MMQPRGLWCYSSYKLPHHGRALLPFTGSYSEDGWRVHTGPIACHGGNILPR
jgi:hypothetical protein